MYNYSASLQSFLSSFANRTLRKGEAIVLARLIAMMFRLPTGDDVTAHYLVNKSRVDNMLWMLNDYVYIDDATRKLIHDTAVGFLLWRVDVSEGSEMLRLICEPNCVVDAISTIIHYVPADTLCAVADELPGISAFIDPMREFISHHHISAA